MNYYVILANYLEQILERSVPDAPVWNVENIPVGIKTSWNYVDGCMVNALLELYRIRKEERYLAFTDAFINSFVNDNGQIHSYDPKEYNLDNIHA